MSPEKIVKNILKIQFITTLRCRKNIEREMCGSGSELEEELYAILFIQHLRPKTPTRMMLVRERGTGVLVHCWWECKMQQLSWKDDVMALYTKDTLAI